MTAKESLKRKIFEFIKNDFSPHVGMTIGHRNKYSLSIEERNVYDEVIKEMLDDNLLEYQKIDYTKSPLGNASFPVITNKGLEIALTY